MRLANKLYRKQWIVSLGVLLITLLAAGCTQTKAAPSSMEVTHASYLDLAGNIADLRSRITEWQKGDESSLKIAEEKLERIQTILAATSWPGTMSTASARTKAAIAPMDKALKAQDQSAAEVASKEFGDASHDVTHAFYGDYLPELQGNQSSQMSAHVIYLDVTANIADLQTRITQWQKGDESSMNVAKEKAERTEALLPHLASTGVMVKKAAAIQVSLLPVFAAIERQDSAAAQQAVNPIIEASRDLTRDAYVWMDIVAATNDPACVQASYLDLSRNITDLRASVTAWQKGDEASLATAREKLARVQILLVHPAWPSEIADAIDRTSGATAQMAKAVGEKNVDAAASAATEFGDASHDVTHSYYGDWLPSGGLSSVKVLATSSGVQSQSQGSSSSHGHGPATATNPAASGPDWLILGGFAGLLALVTGIAAITKPKTAAKLSGMSVPRTIES